MRRKGPEGRLERTAKWGQRKPRRVIALKPRGEKVIQGDGVEHCLEFRDDVNRELNAGLAAGFCC